MLSGWTLAGRVGMMPETHEKRAIILAHEERFAARLAMQVLDRPQLSIWMILIPVIFVYFIYRYQKFAAGRKAFADNYMISRKRALNEALEVVETGKAQDVQGLAAHSKMPEQVRGQHAEMLAVLVEHYRHLLDSEGDDFESLVRSAYGNRTNYLLLVNRLARAEKALHAALIPHLAATTEGVNHVVSTIEYQTEKLRREIAERIFA